MAPFDFRDWKVPHSSSDSGKELRATKATKASDIAPSAWLVLWTMACMAVAFFCWAVHPGRQLSEKTLHTALSSNKVKVTSAEDSPILVPPTLERTDASKGSPICAAQEPASRNERETDKSSLPVVLAKPDPIPANVIPAGIELPPEVPAPMMLPSVIPPPEIPPAELPRVESPKVKAPPQAEPKQEGPAPIEIPQISAPPPAIPPVAPVVAPPEDEIQDEKILIFLPSHPGETPMMQNWKTLTVCSLLAATAFTPAPALLAGEKDNKEILDRLDKMEKNIAADFKSVQGDMESIRGELKKLKDEDLLGQKLKMANVTVKIGHIERDVAKLLADLEGLRKRIPVEFPSGNNKASIDEIKLRLGAIEEAILRLAPTEKRVAMAPPSAFAKVLLVNLYPEELLFVVNQKTYRVGANMTMALDNMPVGAINYEVVSSTWGQRARSTTNLAANETFTLTAR